MKASSHGSFWAGLAVVSAAIVVGIVLFMLTLGPSLEQNGFFLREDSVSGGVSSSPEMTYPVMGMPADEFYRKEGADAGLAIAPSPMPPVYVGGETAATAEPRIIKTGAIALEVSDAREGSDGVSRIAADAGGFVQSSTIAEANDGTMTAYITIRVPDEKFEAVITLLRGLGSRVISESTNGQDVTEQYTDLEARLSSAKAQEAQYLEILKKAETVQDILAVQQYLSSIRYEIESLEGQLRYLGNQTTYATISVSLTEAASLEIPTAKFDILRDIREAGRTVILLFQAFLTFAVWFVIVGTAFFLPIGVLLYILSKLMSRFMKR